MTISSTGFSSVSSKTRRDLGRTTPLKRKDWGMKHDGSTWAFGGDGKEFRRHLERKITSHEARKQEEREAPPEVISRRVDGVEVARNRSEARSSGLRDVSWVGEISREGARGLLAALRKHAGVSR